MESVVRFGRRRGISKSASLAEEAGKTGHPPDLRQITILSKAEWLSIQDELNKRVNKEEESAREAMRRREAMHQRSKEAVKQWSNTIAGQRQKKLEAKKIREQIEEEKRKLTDIEEAKYQEQKRKEAIEKAKTQLYYQTDRVKGLHHALLLTEVLKEREAQIQLKQRLQSASKDVDKEYLEMAKSREEELSRSEQEKAQQRTLQRQAVAEDLQNQIKEHLLAREQQKLEDQKDGEEIQRLQEIYQREQKMRREAQAQQKKNLMKAHKEHLANKDVMRTTDSQKQQAEEEQRKLFLSAKQKMMKLRKDREKELLREAQARRDSIMAKLTATQQQQTDDEEQRIAKAVAEQDAKEGQHQLEGAEKRAAALESIAAHRERMRQEKEERDEMMRQTNRERLQAKKEADRMFSEKRRQKAQSARENARKLQDFNTAFMAEKSTRLHEQKRDEEEFEVKNAELLVEEEKQFQQYSRQVIGAALEAQRNVFPLCKAAREGIGGGLGPCLASVRPTYLVQDSTGAQMPKGATQSLKKVNAVVDIQEAKRRLGLTW